MCESKNDLSKEKLKKKEIIFISKKTIKPEQKENPVKFIVKKNLLFNIQNTSKSSNKKDSIEGKWSKEEHDNFLKGLEIYGTNWKQFNNLIKFRTLSQVRSHAQKFYIKMKSCKNENLGINFTLNSIRNINDMVNQIKITNKNYDVVNIFKCLENEYNSLKKNKKIIIKKNIKNINKYNNENNFNNIKENDINKNNIDLEKNFLLNVIKEKHIIDYNGGENGLLESNEELNLDEE